MGNYIDLHIHSVYSDDGEFTPAELVQQCKDAGLRIIAIADHNCVRGNAEAQSEAERLNISYIPAVEIDCTCNGTNLHVIGYQIDDTSDDFERVEQNILKQELIASKERIKFTNQLGFHVTEDELTLYLKKEGCSVISGRVRSLQKFCLVNLNIRIVNCFFLIGRAVHEAITRMSTFIGTFMRRESLVMLKSNSPVLRRRYRSFTETVARLY